MNITEYCDAINRQIKITYYPNQGGRWCASLEDCEIKDGNILSGGRGDGTSPELALIELIDVLKGKLIVFGAVTDKRAEFKVPEIITVNL
jgi:hypothetical protein